jgi:hypothetical protein
MYHHLKERLNRFNVRMLDEADVVALRTNSIQVRETATHAFDFLFIYTNLVYQDHALQTQLVEIIGNQEEYPHIQTSPSVLKNLSCSLKVKESQ